MRRVLFAVAVLAMGIATSASAKGKPAKPEVLVVADEAHQRVDVTIDGTPFTSYLWPSTQDKPVLYPLIAPGGVEVTRGYPLAPRPGERTDHPHHAGMWFNYGNVDGFDFWNNSDAIKPEQKPKMGTIHHQKIVSTKSGRDSGELVVQSVWTNGAGEDVIQQTTRYVFSRRKGINGVRGLVNGGNVSDSGSSIRSSRCMR